MTKLNLFNGNFTIDKFILSEKIVPDELITHFPNIQIGVRNGDYESYILPKIRDELLGISFYFHKRKIIFFMIELLSEGSSKSFQIDELSKSKTMDLLKSMGGESEYDWGKVSLVNDSKGGITAVKVYYT